MSNPRISVNKLGEYVQITNALRRRKIVYDAKFPQSFKTTRYSDAREFMKKFFTKHYDESVLEEAMKVIGEKQAETDFQEQDKDLSLLALTALSEIGLPDLSDFEVSIFSLENKKLNIKGVEVSVYPDLIIRGKVRKEKVVGAVKIHLSKSNPLLDEGQRTVATVLRKYVEEFVADEGEKVLNTICLSVDVFQKKCEPAPLAFKIRMGQIEVACEEIALWWNSVEKNP